MNRPISKQNMRKMLKESERAASIAVKNREIVETLFSIQEIKTGNFKIFSSAEEMFSKFGI